MAGMLEARPAQTDRCRLRINPDSASGLPPGRPRRCFSGQTRRVWVLGKDGKPQARRITVGLSDGSATEVVAGNLVEGELVVTGETLSK